MLRLVVAAVAVGLLVRLVQFVLVKAGTPLSKNESLFLGLGVKTFLIISKFIDDTLAPITYAAIIVAGFALNKSWQLESNEVTNEGGVRVVADSSHRCRGLSLCGSPTPPPKTMGR